MRLKLYVVTAACFLSFLAFSQSAGKTKNVVAILIDGYRWQELFNGSDRAFMKTTNVKEDALEVANDKYWSEDKYARRQKLMPFTWKVIAKNGQIYGNRDYGNKVNVANPYWISYPGRAEVLSGFVDPAINSNGFGSNPNTNVLEYIDGKKEFTGKVVTFACWSATGRCLHKESSDMLISVPWDNIEGENLTEAEILANEMQQFIPRIYGEDERLDANVYALAKSYILAKHPRVTYLDFGDVDEYAHAGDYNGYLDDIHNLDAMIGNLWNTMQADPFYKDNTTFFIFPDHGRGIGSEWTSHGSSIAHSDETWFMVMGPDTKPLGEMTNKQQLYQTQYAATIAAILGLNYHVQGKTIGEKIQRVLPKE